MIDSLHNEVAPLPFRAREPFGSMMVLLLQFLGEAEGEFDAGDEAGEFVFTAEGADGVEDGVHFF